MFLQTRKGPLRFRDEGPRTTHALVFVHGLGADHRCFVKQLVHFRKKHRVIAFDLPNHGDSFAFENGLSYAAVSDTVKELLDERGVERAVLCGLSLGGHLVQYFAHHHPGYVAGVVDVGSTPLHEPLSFRTFLKLRLYFFSCRFIPKRILVKIIAGKDRGRTEKSQDYLINRIAERTAKRAMLKMLRVMLRTARKGISAPVGAPLLIINGENDQQWLIEKARAWHEEIPGSVHEIIPAAGHIANQDNPRHFNRMLERWLETAGLPGEPKTIPNEK